MNRDEPVQSMARTFVYAILLIIASVAVFNVIIYEGEVPSFLTVYGLGGIGDACDLPGACVEPLQCMSGMCVLLETEKGGRCNHEDLQCASPLLCHNSLCKERAGVGESCDERSMNVCAGDSFCLDGVCRSQV
ncbi:hypothetical protein HY490_02775 [Candidatus Woesearchaeota archaeon]|nr:hypothetical protein [Candidatus Woesearchaeota archaeon]